MPVVEKTTRNGPGVPLALWLTSGTTKLTPAGIETVAVTAWAEASIGRPRTQSSATRQGRRCALKAVPA